MTDRNNKLYAFLKEKKALHTQRFADYGTFRRFCTSVIIALVRDYNDCEFTEKESDDFLNAVSSWFDQVAPVRSWDKGKPKDYFHYDPLHYEEELIEWQRRCDENRKTEEALASIALPDDESLTAPKARALLWNFLYAANPGDLNKSIAAVCNWLLQCKGNLHETNHHHHPLVYISRDREDGSAKGGNGKSFIAQALHNQFMSMGLPVANAVGAMALPSANSDFVSDAYANNILMTLNELPSIRHINEPYTRAIFEDERYSVRKMRQDPYSCKVKAMFIGSTNYQDWYSADNALARRLLLVNVNADLNLDNRELREEVDALHRLPTEADIATAFLTLLRVPDEVYRSILDECEKVKQEAEIETDLDRHTLARILNHLHYDHGENLNAVSLLNLRDELKEFENGHRKWGTSQAAVNSILNKHFGHIGVQYFHGKHLYAKEDLTALAEYTVPDFDSRPSPKEAYDRVWKALNQTPSPVLPTDPDDLDTGNATDATDSTDAEEPLPGIPRSNTAFDSKRSKPVWEGEETRDDYEFETLNPIDPEKAKESIESGDSKTGCKDSTVASMRNFVFECDDASLEWQKKNALRLKQTIANRAVYSGGKSIHTRITIDFEPRDKEEYKRIWQALNERLFFGKADPACANPARKTRRPGGYRLDKDTTQDLLYQNDNVYKLSKCSIMDKIADKERREDLLRELRESRREEEDDDGEEGKTKSRIESRAVRHFLDTPFPKTKGNGGDAHTSVYRAILSCLSGNDRDTLDKVLLKAKSEGWQESELRGDIRNAEKYLAAHHR